MTWADLLSEIREELQESSENEWTDAELLAYANEGVFVIQQLTGWFQRTDNLVPVVGTQNYTLPTSVHRLLRATFDSEFLPQTTQSELDRDIGNWRGDNNETPMRFFLPQWDTFASYPKPDTAGNSVSFDSEYGTIIRIEDPASTSDPDVTFDSELGIVIAIEDTEGGQILFEHDPVADPLSGISQELGTELAYSTDELNFGLYYEAIPDTLSATTDIPQMPTFVQPAIVPYVVFRAFEREGPMQDIKLARNYFSDFGDWMESCLNIQDRRWPEAALTMEPLAMGETFARRLNEVGLGSLPRLALKAHYE